MAQKLSAVYAATVAVAPTHARSLTMPEPYPPSREPEAAWIGALDRLVANIEHIIFGKHDLVQLALIPLLARGHLLLEDVPGVGKTMLGRAIAKSLDAQFRRIQFTPDLMPLDITGSSVYRPSTESFEFRQGPVFTDVLLADEINRATPRTQSSLLECMAERQVTVDGVTHVLPAIFTVIATLNPIEQMGTYPLPEAQLDRFLLRLNMGYPGADAEEKILAAQQQNIEHPISALESVISPEDVIMLQKAVAQVAIEPNVRRYIVAIAHATRDDDNFRLGMSPRGSLALMRASQALALLKKRMFVTPADVQFIAPHVLGHRLLLHPQAALAGMNVESALREAIARVEVPMLNQ